MQKTILNKTPSPCWLLHHFNGGHKVSIKCSFLFDMYLNITINEFYYYTTFISFCPPECLFKNVNVILFSFRSACRSIRIISEIIMPINNGITAAKSCFISNKNLYRLPTYYVKNLNLLV